MKVCRFLVLTSCLLLPLTAGAQEPTSAGAAPAVEAPTAEAPAVQGPRVAIDTSMGTLVVELNQEKAPLSTKNFLQYVEEGFYRGTVFHRVIPKFMIQGGGMTPDLKKKDTREAIRNEADNGLLNARGTIAMARMRNPHSATAQFYINLVDNGQLDHAQYAARGDWGYAVFGKVVEGMEIVDAIAGVQTTRQGPHANVPVEVVRITGAKVVE